MKPKSLTKDKINVPVHPLPIQQKIVAKLDKEIESFKGMRQEAEKRIERRIAEVRGEG
jgi:restriction endonuclease S subunit